jgi:hypothetical protein
MSERLRLTVWIVAALAIAAGVWFGAWLWSVS